MDITFKYKDYKIQGTKRYKLMTLARDEFIRRFLIHVLPKGFHRIRHYALLTNGSRADNVAKSRLTERSEAERTPSWERVDGFVMQASEKPAQKRS
jgi:Putative transposase